jgi:hypothetical protein
MSNRLQYDSWPNTPNEITNTYEVIWQTPTLNFKADFYECIFQINHDQIWIKVEVDGQIVMDLYLDDLHDNYKLRSVGEDEAGATNSFSIQEYSSKRWRFKPPVPLTIDTSMKIYMRSQSGTRRVERGMSVWGET